MRRVWVGALVAVMLIGSGAAVSTQPQPQGYTLEDIYYFLADGREAVWGGHNMEPQFGRPGDYSEGYTKSLNDLYYYMVDIFGQATVTTDDIISGRPGATGKYFFSTVPGAWGLQKVPPTTPSPTPAPSPSPMPSIPANYIVTFGGLQVAKNTNNPGTSYNSQKNWWDATAYAASLNWLGREDWRLPTKDELALIYFSLNQLDGYDTGYYWSSTTLQDFSDYAYYVWFLTGLKGNGALKSKPYFFRVVRSRL